MKRWKCPILRLVFLLPLGGCSFYSYGFNNAFHDLSKSSNDRKEIAEHQAQARKAWQTVIANHEKFSVDHRDGFLCGYESYLYAGERSPISALPPRYYTNHDYQSPAGQAAVQDWMAGFRHGMQDAKASGQRDLVIVPINMDSISQCEPATSDEVSTVRHETPSTKQSKDIVEKKKEKTEPDSPNNEQSKDAVSLLRPPPLR